MLTLRRLGSVVVDGLGRQWRSISPIRFSEALAVAQEGHECAVLGVRERASVSHVEEQVAHVVGRRVDAGGAGRWGGGRLGGDEKCERCTSKTNTLEAA